MSQPSFVWSIIFSTVGKHISHVHVSFIFAKFKKRIKLLCAKLVFFHFFPIFVSWFYQHTKGLIWQHQVQTHATHHLESDPSWISLQANHLNSSNHCIWKRRFWKPVCTTQKSYEGKGVQLFNKKVLRSRSLRERPTKVPNVNSLVHRRTRRRVGEGGRPLAWKFSGQTLFSVQAQVAH